MIGNGNCNEVFSWRVMNGTRSHMSQQKMVHDQNMGIYPIIDNDGCDNGERNWISLCRFFHGRYSSGHKKRDLVL